MDATDGEIGKVKDLYIDDVNWAIRYALVDTWKTLPGRRVLLSPSSFSDLNLIKEQLMVNLDKETIRKSPKISERSSLTFETEEKLADYYGWLKYWNINLVEDTVSDAYVKNAFRNNYNLRSEADIRDCRVHAANGRMGKIVDGVFNTKTWTVQSFVLQLKYQPENGLLLVTPEEFISSEWSEGDLYLNGSREAFMKRPIYKSMKELHQYSPNL